MVRTLLVLAVVACGHPSLTAPLANTPTRPALPPSVDPPAKLLSRLSVRVATAGDNIYVDGGGPLMISRDRGRSFGAWRENASLCVSDVLAAPAGGTLYVIAAICSATDVKTDPDMLLRSTDAGVTWQNVGVTAAILRGLDPRDPRVIYAEDVCGTSTSVCRSDDGGATWNALLVPPPSPKYAMLAGELFVADDGALIYVPPRDNGFEVDRSVDRGVTWSVAMVDPKAVDLHISAIEANGAIIAENLDHCGVVRSIGGHPFQTVLSPESCEPGSSIIGHGHFACGVFADDKVFASNDSGVSWRPLALDHAHFDVTAVGADGKLTELTANARFNCYATADRLLIAAADGLYALAPPW